MGDKMVVKRFLIGLDARVLHALSFECSRLQTTKTQYIRRVLMDALPKELNGNEPVPETQLGLKKHGFGVHLTVRQVAQLTEMQYREGRARGRILRDALEMYIHRQHPDLVRQSIITEEGAYAQV